MRNLTELKSFNSLKITLASPEDILSWSFGEITKPETINYRTFRPEKEGLFDERIFGPVKDYECYCGKYKRIRYKGVICDKCGVEVTHSRVRRERMGHIALVSPVAHVWFFRGIPSKMSALLQISPRNLEAVIYFSSFIVTDINLDKKVSILSKVEVERSECLGNLQDEGDKRIIELTNESTAKIKDISIKSKEQKDIAREEVRLKYAKMIAQVREELVVKKEEASKKYEIIIKKLESIKKLTIMADMEYLDLSEYVDEFCEVGIGAEAVLSILKGMDLNELAKNLRKKIEKAEGVPAQAGQRFIKLIKRLRVVEGFRREKIDPSWMITTHIPVIPPDIRPMVQLEGGRFATSDLNDLYRRVINRNNRLKRLLELGAPEIIVRNEKRMLQEAVDALIDSSRQRTKRPQARGKKELRSLSDLLKGKQGRFRQNLLGKRVDYSGRAVIVVGPDLKLTECGIPKEMALELFKPFVLREVLARGLAPNVKSAKYVLEERSGEIWDILEEVVKERPILLNRAPTLWRLGIQAFYPRLIDGNAIQLHPCVCAGFNADFDGDQTAVHVPLSKNCLREAKEILISSNNLLRPSDGSLISLPTKDMLLGTYYLTSIDIAIEKHKRVFADTDEVLSALDNRVISIRQKIEVFMNSKILETSAGRVLFNKVLPSSFKYINSPVAKSAKGENLSMSWIIEYSIQNESVDKTVKLIDDIKTLGFEYATRSGLSLAITDCTESEKRGDILKDAYKKSEDIDQNFRRGLITKSESSSLHISLWVETTDKLDQATWDSLTEENPIKMILNSGANRASRDQLKQISAMKGLVTDPMGKIVEMPIIGNYKEGLTGFEYFAASRGARKGLTDKALKTADAGYLTRRMVDVAQDVIVREDDCGAEEGRKVKLSEKTMLVSFAERIIGRYLLKDIKDKNKIVYKKGVLVTEDIAKDIEKRQISEVEIRSPLGCETRYGICSKCYGVDLMTKKPVGKGVPVGVAAAQSIGEPGTQLTLRTFHTGGIAIKDITQGLPRVEELFEARTPKSLSVMTEISGKIKVLEDGDKRVIGVKPKSVKGEIPDVMYNIDPVDEIIVRNGDTVSAGDALTLGYLDLSALTSIAGIKETQKYIVNEVQKVYSSQGVSINDKHIEVIVRQMFSKLIIEGVGDTTFLAGEIVTRSSFEDENERVLAEGGSPAEARIILLGITKASLETDSFLSAASFQETTRILTDAASCGKVDKLLGLKENVIIGRLIPVGDRANLECPQ
ncbi:DNA-directed RNA polymerase subunit beta' [Patescibacteria group bacterium]|nr:DNA-directed RNA polymerase subunit beta' [Patescibacteria group bacterium]